MVENTLLLQFERVFDAGNLIVEMSVDAHTLLHLITTVNDRRVVASSNQFSNASRWHLSVFLSQVHRNLTGLNILVFAAAPCHCS